MLVPFIAGVVLDPEVATSRRIVDLMLRMFARGRSVVPALGMQQIPQQLAHGLPRGTVHTQTPVRAVGEGRDHTEAREVATRTVVVATDGWTAARLLPGRVEVPVPRSVLTVYHAAPRWECADKTLVVDGDTASPVINSVVLTTAAPTYAADGRHLVATSLAGAAPVGDLRPRLAALHRTDTSDWEEVGRYDIPHALPAMPAPHRFRTPGRRGNATYVCGDHVDTSSIQGALVSGRRAAQAVLCDLGVTR